MNIRLLLIAIAVSLVAPEAFGASPAGSPQLHLMPMPSSLALAPGKLRVNSNFQISYAGVRTARLEAAAGRAVEKVWRKTGLPAAAHPAAGAPPLRIDCRAEGSQRPSLSDDESYTLEVTAAAVRLSAPEVAGALRGLETFIQLVDLDAESFFLPCVKVSDRPRYRWRGLHLDVSRHWQPVEFVKRTLDAMAAVKLNVFHWHLSDDQGFRVESRAFPNLHRAASDGLYYTQAQMREVVAYAGDRGIRVVPEFDMPGHSSALLVAYPELGSSPEPSEIARTWGGFAPTLNPADEKVYGFLDTFVKEVAGLFPDEYFHIGGDEVMERQWSANPELQRFKRRQGFKDNRDLQAYFTRRVADILRKHGRKVICWDEALHPELPKDVVVQSWRAKPPLSEALRQGRQGILSRGFYLDHMRTAAFHYENDPEGGEAAKLSAAEKGRILGGEACMWAEFVNEHNVDSRIWPRAAVVAERLWSPASVRDVPDMYRRLAHVEKELAIRRGEGAWLQLRMTPDADADALQALTELLRPVPLGSRMRARKYRSDTPLNRLADILPPESRTARRFAELVGKALAKPSPADADVQAVRDELTRWQSGLRRALPALQKSFLLKEAVPVAQTADGLATLGLEALRAIESGGRLPVARREQARLLLDKAKKIQAETEIAVAPEVEKLVKRAGE
ncbi:MAG: family 20 glycosylhydrolase [Acidobacteriota bacterium]|jgi:hexosaminidase|nr:family 20 glycosylhydrolase [Acidobacteriota bacterium]